MQTTIVQLARFAVFGALLLFSLIVLGISANFASISSKDPAFEGLCIVVAVLTFVTVIPVVAIDFFRRGAFTSLVVTEIVWVFVLMILWVAAAGETSATLFLFDNCSDIDDDLQSRCHQAQALQAFAWLNFIILLGWLISLCVCSAIAHSKGNPNVWTSPISETSFFSSGASSGQPAMAASTDAGGYPPHQAPSYQITPPQQSYQGTPVSHQPPPPHVAQV